MRRQVFKLDALPSQLLLSHVWLSGKLGSFCTVIVASQVLRRWPSRLRLRPVRHLEQLVFSLPRVWQVSLLRLRRRLHQLLVGKLFFQRRVGLELQLWQLRGL
jgi:hypothetical protein